MGLSFFPCEDCSSAHDLVQIDSASGGLQLTREGQVPSVARFYRLPDHAGEVARDFPRASLQRADLVAPKPPYEVAGFEQHVLPGARLRVPALCATFVIGREENDHEADVAFRLDLFDDRAPLVCLLMENDGLEPELVEELRDRLLGAFVVSADDAGPVRERHGPRYMLRSGYKRSQCLMDSSRSICFKS